MGTPHDQRARDSVISARNKSDKVSYQASIVWERKWIKTEEASIFGDKTKIERYSIFADACIWRGSWINLIFQPTLLMGYSPTQPTDPRPEIFRQIVRQVIDDCNLPEMAAGMVLGICRGSVRRIEFGQSLVTAEIF